MLHGLRVLDLSIHLAGPYCTWLLAGLGADVIKIERPGTGDPARATVPFVAGESLYFASVNRNKRSLTVDLKTPEGREIVCALARRSDVLIENFRPGVMERLGLSPAVLREVNAALVYCSISGFGQSGPLRERPAYDVVVQAFSGMMSVTGPEGGPPVRAGVSIGDLAAGVFAATDILAALLERERGGPVRRLDVAMADCQLALLENAVARALNTTEEPRPLGTRHPSVTPFQAFETRDGMIVVAAAGDAEWARLCRALELPGLASDPRYASSASRHAHQRELIAALAAVFAQRPGREWLEVLAAHDVPCGPVQSVSAAARSEQMSARGMIQPALAPGRPELAFAACPVGTRSAAADRPAPRLGEHTAEILLELGYTRDDFAQWSARGIV